MVYNKENVFAQILKGQLEADKVYEDEHVLAFHDIAPVSYTHLTLPTKA